MPRITHLKTIDGALWAKLELDLNVEHGPVHVYTEKEIIDLRNKERKLVWEEIQEACSKYEDKFED